MVIWRGGSLTLALGDGEFYNPSNKSAPERGRVGRGWSLSIYALPSTSRDISSRDVLQKDKAEAGCFGVDFETVCIG